MPLTSVEVCAGAGGQALGLEAAGFKHLACVEMDARACETLRQNRPQWNTLQMDLNEWSAQSFKGKVDLFAGGVPCPPFSKAGKQLGADDERNLFPRALELIRQADPRAVMIENVRGLLDPQFEGFRDEVSRELASMGFRPHWKLLHASDFGVSQLRPRVVMVAIKDPWDAYFTWPEPARKPARTVGQLLFDLMSSNGWEGASEWARQANAIAPTLVGGSHKHGGPDLGPTRARKAWAQLGVDGKTIAPAAPEAGFTGTPRLTVEMGALVQGFPPDWKFSGPKTAAWRQVGNAFPPPVAAAVGTQIAKALNARLDTEPPQNSARAQEPELLFQ
ncbi:MULTISPECIES: DNA cytosine methyltransferase [unclassified Luteococcus]|uniref:DNA cytosine methyltransferase n=1 Tax=unclassified Luteococcus TaxID=2639923 RepID=UPI00313AEE09